MAKYFSLEKWADQVGKAKTVATMRALNKASAKTKTQFIRAMVQASGLKNKDVSRRIRVQKATKGSLTGYVSLGTKFDIPLSYFSPKEKTVRIGRRKYKGVTVKIPSEGGRIVVPKGFMAYAKSGKSLVLARKGQAKYPTKDLKHSLAPSARAEQGSLQRYMKEEFDSQFSSALAYAMKEL